MSDGLSSGVVASNQPRKGERGDSLSTEEEQTADQLLADIQSAVDEMLHDFQTNTLSPESTPTPPPSQPLLPPSTSPPSSYSTASIDKVCVSDCCEAMMIQGSVFRHLQVIHEWRFRYR